MFVFATFLFTIVKGDGKTDNFLGDILSTFKLISPTIIYSNDEAPKICLTRQWVLCLSNSQETEHSQVAEHIQTMFYDRKQDSILFVGHQSDQGLLEELVQLEPAIFRWSSPVFMPIEYVDTMRLRLDSNVIFYEEEGDANFNLIDMFAVKGGPRIILDMGIWDEMNGIRLHRPLGRWDRRRDLKKTELVNSLTQSGSYVWLSWDYNCSLPEDFDLVGDHCNITNSHGYYQEKLFYITDGLNLTIRIVEAPWWEELLQEDGTWGGEIGQLERKETDVFSRGLFLKEERKTVVDFTLPIDHSYRVLAAGIPKGRAPSMWAYVNVFGVVQWIIFLASLMGIVVLMSIMRTISKEIDESSWTKNALTASVMACMFAIQGGEHPNDRHFGTRLLSVTLSILTLLFFVYYTTDITAKMTTGPPPMPVQNFEDVITFGYKVITSSYLEEFFSHADPGTARYKIYQTNFENIDNISVYPAFGELEMLLEEPKTLLYIDRASLIPEVIHDDYEYELSESEKYWHYLLSQIMFLRVEGAGFHYSSLALQKDSEFLGAFNYYLMKEYEHGISARLFRKYHIPLYIKEEFGMMEPQPLGYENVMSLFILLGLGITASWVIAIVEMLENKCRKWASSGFTNRKETSDMQQRPVAVDSVGAEMHGKDGSNRVVGEMREEDIVVIG